MAGASPSRPPDAPPGAFQDSARVTVRAGRGGHGSASFRREPFIPRGGPDGGDGGRGGSVVLVAGSDLASLAVPGRRSLWHAEDGQAGAGGRKTGRAGADLRLEVPVGTAVMDEASGEVLVDLDQPGAEYVAARGGQGGRGNVRFASSINRAPHVAERGRKGEERQLLLDLRLLADAGLVGPPNAGKSSLLAAISAARPRVADYPFTTLTPELGVAEDAAGRRLVVADVPGLIEGAAGGAGLGLRFLRHVERARALVFVIDAAGEDPEATFEAVRAEVGAYSAELLNRPSMVVFNKVDLEAGRRFRKWHPHLEALYCSALTGEGVEAVVEAMSARLAGVPVPEPTPEVPRVQLKPRGRRVSVPPVVSRQPWGFSVSGPRVEGLVAATDFDSAPSLDRFQALLDRIGVSAALEEAGARPGDTVRIGDLEFEYQP